TPSALSRAVLPPSTSAGGGRAAVGIGQGSRLGAILPGAPLTAGYLPTLLLAAQIPITRQDLQDLGEILKLFRAFAEPEGGDLSQLQVDQAEQQLLQERSTLLRNEFDYRESLDQFKLQLGLPTDLPLELDDTPIRPITRQLQRYESVFKQEYE